MRRSTRRPQDEKLKRALRTVFRGIYYRHEFARRNNGVRNESHSLLGQLGMSADRAHQFFLPNDKTMLTDEIIRKYKGAPLDTKEQMRQALLTFFKARRVLPMTGSPVNGSSQTFFPKLWNEKGDDAAEKLFWMWNSLLNFELFCLARLELGTPVFFPVMQISRGKNSRNDPQELVEVSRKLALSEFRFPLLTSLEMPIGQIGAYFEVFRFQERIDLHLSKSGLDEGRWHRIPWEDFDWTLKVYDFSLRPRVLKLGEDYHTFCKEERAKGEGPKKRRRNKKPKKRRKASASQIAEVEYYTHLRRAKRWINAYSRII